MQLVTAVGDYDEMGYQIGQARADAFHRVLTRYRRLLEIHGVRWNDLKGESRVYQAFIHTYLPQYWKEMQGIANGAEMKFDDLFLLEAFQEIQTELQIGCTSLAVGQEATSDGSVLLAHNEDWLPSDAQEMYVLQARPKDAPDYLCLSYVGYVHQGFNSAGIGSVGNAVSPRDVRPGIPRLFAYRDVLDKVTLGEALEATVHPHRAAGNNHILASAQGEIYDIEVSATRYDTMYAHNGFLIHTNHYVSDTMKEVETPGASFNSMLRWHRLNRLLSEHVGEITVELLQKILSDHVNGPDAICSHTESISEKTFQYSTIGAVIIDLTHKVLYACQGPPCQGTFEAFGLSD